MPSHRVLQKVLGRGIWGTGWSLPSAQEWRQPSVSRILIRGPLAETVNGGLQSCAPTIENRRPSIVQAFSGETHQTINKSAIPALKNGSRLINRISDMKSIYLGKG